MISYIKGIITDKTEDGVVIETGGIGFGVNASVNTVASLPSVGDEAIVYTFMNVKEDDISLYGFSQKKDIDIFKKLISVSGIGPKGALSIMSSLSTDDLITAIMAGDVKAISAANGIGKKTAERVILELKDKIDLEELYTSSANAPSAKLSMEDQNIKDTILALTALGISASDAARAVKAVPDAGEMTAEQLLKASLKNVY
ncbi:MAG: Holliday junction branch migration protein RuvA [Eubacterium sp.]|nr:Holliday junction branch migration protein RuvA [Eubacterium sp.]